MELSFCNLTQLFSAFFLGKDVGLIIISQYVQLKLAISLNRQNISKAICYNNSSREPNALNRTNPGWGLPGLGGGGVGMLSLCQSFLRLAVDW